MPDLADIEKGLDPQTVTELHAADVRAGRPLVVIDMDDTLIHFVGHLSRWMRGRGFEMRLDTYQLEGSMFQVGSDRPLPFDDCIAIINDFFAAETERQQPIPGAVAAIGDLSGDMQIVFLTNVPRHAAAGRQANLAQLGLDHPLVINTGGKGRAMAWLAARAEAPLALVDDSTTQLESVARHAPDAVRVHFAGTEHIARLYPTCETAHAQVRDWPDCVATLRRLLGL